MIDISIIIPVYNTEKFLSKCLESVCSLKLKNKEIILINDGSQDNSINIMNEYKKIYPKNIIVINQENKGLSFSRNKGIIKSEGKYILFIDSDDFINPIETENFLIKGINYGADILIGNSSDYYSDNKIVKDYFTKKIEPLKENKGIYFLEERIKTKCFYVGVCRNLYKKEFLLKNNLFFCRNLLYEDTLFTPIAFYKANKVIYSSEYFYNYRQNNEDSITHKKSLNHYIHILWIINELLNFFQNERSNKYINKFIISLYINVIRRGKIKSKNIQNRIFLLNNICLKDRIKKIYILFQGINLKECDYLLSSIDKKIDRNFTAN